MDCIDRLYTIDCIEYIASSFWFISCCLLLLQMIAAPFAAGALFLPFPWCFISLLPAFAFGEMWIGVTIAVVMDIVPVLIQGSVIAVYLFIITVIGGNFMQHSSQLLCLCRLVSLGREWALLITFPAWTLHVKLLSFYCGFLCTSL